MGALLSQAVANQLRQFPRSQDPRPGPPELLQQVLNPPGPSRPNWMAPVMENQQLMETGMDPNLTPVYRQAIQQALARDALKNVMAFGGADITKEQRLKWEAENEAYRADRALSGTDPKMGSYPPGTRVLIRPYVYREDIKTPTRGGLGPKGRGVTGKELPWNEPHMEGVVVTPGTPEAGKPSETSSYWTKREKASAPYVEPGEEPVPLTPPTGDHVAVRVGSHWDWRHRDALEILPPLEEFPHGTKVEHTRGYWVPAGKDAMVGPPPRGQGTPPSPDHVWVDYTPSGKYEGFPMGGWYPKQVLKKK